MVRFRHLVAWLVMALVPLQAFAAASKVCCAARHLHPVAASTSALEPANSMHYQAIALSRSLPRTEIDRQAPSDHAAWRDETTRDVSSGASSGTEPRGMQSCGVCASLCHAVAISPSWWTWDSGVPEAGDLAAALRLLSTRPFTVADKPPRG